MKNFSELINGLQHIGLPTSDVQKTIDFYASLGFEVAWENRKPAKERVAFLKKGSCVMETYYSEAPAMTVGSVDHVALDVTDIDAAYEAAKALGYTALEGQITFLPFFANGVRFFTILGPNREKVEFNQYL